MKVQPDQLVELTIENISHQGEGVAKLQGYTVFVPFAAPGDVVRAKVVSAKKDYARAVITEILKYGQRVEPKCRWFQECGGCNLQHLDYNLQLAIKTETVKTTLQRIGGISPEIVKDILPTQAWSYRNKLQAPVATYRGQLTAGLYKPRSHVLVPVTGCIIQEDVNNQIAEQIGNIARETGVAPWSKDEKKGSLRHILIRTSQAKGQTLAALVVSRFDFLNRERFLRVLRERTNLHSLVLNENPHPTNVILGKREEIVWGPGYITDTIQGLDFKISAGSFWQVNRVGMAKIIRKVREYANLSQEETVLDLYCGTGSIGLCLAQEAAKIIGIESNGRAIEDARDNARMNGIVNAEFHAGRAEALLPQMVTKGLKADVIILDPPRKGCEPSLLEATAKANPQRIVYVSCNPATLARDLKLLAELGYLAREVQPVDMFPQTSHVECIILMTNSGLKGE